MSSVGKSQASYGRGKGNGKGMRGAKGRPRRHQKRVSTRPYATKSGLTRLGKRGSVWRKSPEVITAMRELMEDDFCQILSTAYHYTKARNVKTIQTIDLNAAMREPSFSRNSTLTIYHTR